jgi:DNA-binding MarR family transcriptional regulator
MNSDDPSLLRRQLSRFRRATLGDLLDVVMRTLGDFDLSMSHFAALMLLEDEHPLTIKEVSGYLGRSVSATSRLLDQLVRRGLVSRREDARDRRAKCVAITEEGRALLREMERGRTDAQLAVMAYLSEDERAEVMRAMALLAEASARRDRDEHNHPPDRAS